MGDFPADWYDKWKSLGPQEDEEEPEDFGPQEDAEQEQGEN